MDDKWTLCKLAFNISFDYSTTFSRTRSVFSENYLENNDEDYFEI